MASSESYWPSAAASPLFLAAGRVVQLLTAFPVPIFFICLIAMLFRPPDLPLYSIDHAALVLLVVSVVTRTLIVKKRLAISTLVALPLTFLVILSLSSILFLPFQPENWSVWLAKWVVPLSFYLIAGHIFENQEQLEHLESFLLVVLGYLVLLALLFLFDLKSLIFPRYILDESIGIHTERARGPFLQAVANGMAINILAILGIDSFRRGSLKGLSAIILLAGVPLAIFATLTRAVWICFAGSMAAVAFLFRDNRVRKAALWFAVIGILGIFLFLTCSASYCRFSERLEERSPVDFRIVMLQTGLQMFTERPWMGWNAADVQPELADRVIDFHQPQYFFHNTYLEIAVYHGLIGLALYAWLIFDLFRVGSRRFMHPVENSFLGDSFRRVWPVILAVYLVNANFVVMNYQFVNALLFSLAGLLAAHNRSQLLPGRPRPAG